MTMDKVKSFVLDSRGGMVTLQIGTLVTLFVMFYAGVNWKRDIEDAMKNRWTSIHMELWAAKLSTANPQMAIPEPVDILNYVED